jgi:hypothetical protein
LKNQFATKLGRDRLDDAIREIPELCVVTDEDRRRVSQPVLDFLVVELLLPGESRGTEDRLEHGLVHAVLAGLAFGESVQLTAARTGEPCVGAGVGNAGEHDAQGRFASGEVRAFERHLPAQRIPLQAQQVHEVDVVV